MNKQLDPLLVRQHGLVTRRQAWGAGVSDKQVDVLIAQKRLIVVHRGVYRDPAAPVTRDQRALASVLAAGDGTAVSHRHAIAHWGMRNYDCLLREITTKGFRQIPGIVSHRSIRTPDQTVLRLVPVTSPARTIIDVATQVNQALLGMWMETWLSTKLLALDALEAQMVTLKGHGGVPLVRAALTDRMIIHAAADSPPEAALGLLLQSHGLPPLTLHHAVTTSTGLDFELDWSYPQWQIAFEMDGYGVHLRSRDAFDNDRVRRNELEIDGWTVMNFTKRLVERRSKTVVNQVERLLERRGLLD